MKYIKSYSLFENNTVLTQEQIDWLNKCTRGTWKLNPNNGLVDVDGNFYGSKKNLNDFKGVRFGVVTGGFYCDDNQLTSLVGAPQEVGEDFNCRYNKLVSLLGAPRKVGGNFYCSDNNVSLETLRIIFNRMKSGMSYPLALAASKNDIPQDDWDILDKKGYSPEMDKAISILGGFGLLGNK